jgi:hypothetical protein
MAGRTKRFGTGWIILIAFVVIIVIARLLLPTIILDYVNKQLKENPKYDGNVGGITLSILAGDYALQEIVIHEVDGQQDEPMFSAEEIWFKIDYGSLFKGKVVGEIEFATPVINYVQTPERDAAAKDPGEEEENLTATLDEMMPVTIDRFKITNGRIVYRDVTSSPAFSAELRNLQLVATNLSTQPAEGKLLPSDFEASAITTGEGNLNTSGRFNPLAEVPTFDVNLEITDLQIVSFNEYVKDAAKLNLAGGTFGLHVELAAKNGFFTGYAKPVINALEIRPYKEDETGLLQRIYESAASVIKDLLEAPGEDQIALRVPLEGEFEDPDAHVWTAIITLLRNAFIEALVPSIDHSVSIGQVTEVIEERTGN